MANSFFSFVTQMVAGALARAEDVNSNLQSIEAGFDAVEAVTDQSLKVTSSPGTVAIVLNAAARANKLLSFDANGDIAATTIIGDWKGAHADAAGTDYQIRDVVKDAAGSLSLNSLYICTATHTSTGSLSTDTANWELLISATIGNAASVNIADAGGLITATDVEAALQEAFTAIALNTAKTSNATHTGEVTGATALTVDVSAITNRTALTSGLAGTDELLVNDAGTLKRMDVSVIKDYLYGTEATTHHRAGLVQTVKDYSTGGDFSFAGLMSALTWESVGPTGSGADNIWAALDNVPSNVKAIIVEVYLQHTSSAAGSHSTLAYAEHGDVASPGTSYTRIGYLASWAGAGSETRVLTNQVIIPVNSSGVFKVTWNHTSTSARSVILGYRGFISE